MGWGALLWPFKKLGKLFQLIYEKVPAELQRLALDLVKQAAREQLDNAGRREWVVAQIMKRTGAKEYVARLATELAVTAIKHKLS